MTTAKAIWVDNREPQAIQDLNFDNVPKMVTMLDCGDLWISTDTSDLIIIERKTGDDLLASIKDKRLLDQCARMREKTPWCYLVITDVLSPTQSGQVIVGQYETRWNWGSLQGALLSVQELGVQVVQADDYVETVLRLARRSRDKEKVIMPAAAPRVLAPGEQVLCALPGIGIERAQQIMNSFDGAGHAMAWLTWMGMSSRVPGIAGIGDGTKRNVRRALGLNDDEELYIMTPVDYENAAKRLKETRALPVEPNQVVEEEGVLLWAA